MCDMKEADVSKAYFSYWGKAHDPRRNKTPQANHCLYHLLPFHNLDVAAVGHLLLCPHKKTTQDLAALLDISLTQLNALFTFFLALHDLGKFASAFQALYSPEDDVSKNNKLIIPNNRFGYDGAKYRHDKMGLYFWKEMESPFLEKIGLNDELEKNALPKSKLTAFKKTLMVLMECVLGHHGQPIDKKDISGTKPFTEPHNLDAACAFVRDVYSLIQPDFPMEKFCDNNWRLLLKQASWPFAGVAVLADWIGSNQDYFQYQSEPMTLKQYWPIAKAHAQKALEGTGLGGIVHIAPFQCVKHHFGFEPTPLQAWAQKVAINDFPQLFILEDVTGSGKTEAALTLVHRLMAAGAAEGFYFGLPTMATSNAMFSRIADHYLEMFTGEGAAPPSIVLAHGARDMNDRFQKALLESGPTDNDYQKSDHTATAQCNQWLADSRKKALLAAVGVGTIDQALLAVLPRRHQSLRLLGLNRKVLIFDEVHAADEYMFELLEEVLKVHLRQGGSVILLTATLPHKQRQRLVNIWLNAAGMVHQTLQKTAFPLATHIRMDAPIPVTEQAFDMPENEPSVDIKSADIRAADIRKRRDVKICLLHSEQACIDTVLLAVEKGQCVVWIRNTVNDALAAFSALQQKMQHPEDCTLFHSRFILNDRKEIENKVITIFGKDEAKNKDHQGDQRRGKVLIATQVFQESLDADMDVMISDICPIDDLIQRAGRLHRHPRNAQGVFTPESKDKRAAPVLYVHAPKWDPAPQADWLSAGFQNTQYVYRSPGRLWLGLRELMRLGAICMPKDARQLIEAVYSDEADAQIPEALMDIDLTAFGDGRASAAKASSQLLKFESGYCDNSSKFWSEDQHDISTRFSDIEIVSVLLLKYSDEGECVPWVDSEKFAVALSTVKVSKNKYADKLSPLSEVQTNAVHRAYPQTKYLQLWLPAEDSQFGYDAVFGFCEKGE